MYKKIEINDFRLFKNHNIMLGKYITVLSGRNSTGKSTILGMIANSGELKKKDGVTYSSKQFRAEFSELFKGSKKFDISASDRFKIIISDIDGNDVDYRSFRTAWQSVGKNKGERFRVIPLKKFDDGRKTESKFDYPILYLGLSRLFPIGESSNDSITAKIISFRNEEHKSWFLEQYKQILSMQTDVKEITNYSIGESEKKNGIGISTNEYDYLTNSSGQDNLGQILLALLSFRRIKEDKKEQWKGGILLIDEIDSTLHPASQNRLLQLFVKEARLNSLQIILTTHSISLLENICGKITYNSHENTVNNDIELYYLTNANRKLEIKRNISFSEIESDLLVRSIIQDSNKIKLYSEDSENRWFLKYLVPEYLGYIELLDITIGCDQLINLFNADIGYFGNTLIVFDGDVKEKQLDKIPKQIRENLGNIVKLPGNVSPEELLYDYLLQLDSEHAYWKVVSRMGFTWDYFKENGPHSERYTSKKDREKYKKWFLEHEHIFDSSKLMEFWVNDNQTTVEEFKANFKKVYNHISKRMLSYPIE